METTLIKSRVLAGLQCPYCMADTEFIDSDAVYSRSYGMIYICRPCEAWVGVHGGTKQALGRVANKELRECRQEAHKYFDQLWRRKMRATGESKSDVRNEAYAWLAPQMGKKLEETHIGMFNLVECYTVIAICKPYYRDNA